MTDEITKLKTDIDRLQSWNKDMQKLIEELKEYNAATKLENQNLRRENLELKETLDTYKRVIKEINTHLNW